MKNGEASNQPPGGFVMPKVWIDENVLQKDSPIYQNGQYLVYQGALTLKEEVAGKNANYCYARKINDILQKEMLFWRRQIQIRKI